LNAGVGFTDWGFVPFYFGADFGLVRDVTLGGQVSFLTNNEDYYYNNDNYNHSSAVGIGVNGNYHFNRILDIPSKFDFYAGANVTGLIWNYDNKDYHPKYDPLNVGVQVGGRVFFNDHFGINLELGGGSTVSGAKFGITYKL
jgi:outer membrane immunogenic protein